MPPPSGKITGLNIEKLTQMTKTAQSPSYSSFYKQITESHSFGCQMLSDQSNSPYRTGVFD